MKFAMKNCLFLGRDVQLAGIFPCTLHHRLIKRKKILRRFYIVNEQRIAVKCLTCGFKA